MNILITGASRGIGAATAKYLARKKVKTLFLTARNINALEHLKKDIAELNPDTEVFPIAADLSAEDGILKVTEFVGKKTPKLDRLLNNAGYLVSGSFASISQEEILRSFMINYFAPSNLIKSCLPLLENASKAHVVNISSMAGFQGSQKFVGLSHYSASKAAIASLTELLAAEFHGEIIFNCLAIGAVDTEMLKEAFPGYKAPLQADEMAEYIGEFLLTAGRYMNGKIIPVSLVSP